MPDLEMLLRDVRPAPDPAWAAKLDARVAARFPGPPPRWKQPLHRAARPLRSRSALAAATVAALLLIVVVDRQATSTTRRRRLRAAPAAPASGAAATVERQRRELGSAPTAAPTPAPPADASTDRAATARRRPQPPAADRARHRATPRSRSPPRPTRSRASTDRAIRVVDSARRLRPELGARAARLDAPAPTLTLKIPSDKLDDGLAQLSKLAHVAVALAADPGRDRPARGARGRACATPAPTATGLRARLAKATTDKERSRLRALLDRATRRVTARAARRRRSSASEVAYADVDLDDPRAAQDPAPRRRPRRPLDARRRARRRRPRARGHRRRAGDRASRSCSRSPDRPCWRRSRAAS